MEQKTDVQIGQDLPVNTPSDPATPVRNRRRSVGGVKVSDSKDALIKYLDNGRGSWLKGREHDQKTERRYRFTDTILDLLLINLEPHPLQPRRTVNQKEIEGFTHSMFYHGLGDPILVMPQPGNPEKYWIIDGLRRCAAARKLGWKKIKAHLSTLTQNHEVLSLMVAIDAQREGFNNIEKGIAFRNLRDDLCIPPSKLATYLKISKSIIVKCERCVSNLSEKIVEAYCSVPENRLSIAYMLQLARLKDVKFTEDWDGEDGEPLWRVEQERLYWASIEEGWKVSELKELIDALLRIRNLRGQGEKLDLDLPQFSVTIKAKGRVARPLEVNETMAFVMERFFSWRGMTREETMNFYKTMYENARREWRESRGMSPD